MSKYMPKMSALSQILKRAEFGREDGTALCGQRITAAPDATLRSGVAAFRGQPR